MSKVNKEESGGLSVFMSLIGLGRLKTPRLACGFPETPITNQLLSSISCKFHAREGDRLISPLQSGFILKFVFCHLEIYPKHITKRFSAGYKTSILKVWKSVQRYCSA